MPRKSGFIGTSYVDVATADNSNVYRVPVHNVVFQWWHILDSMRIGTTIL